MFKHVDSGSIELIDHMGDDEFIAKSARVSVGPGTKQVRDTRGLLRYLMKNEHMSPFEMVRFVFRVKAPLYIARQWFRHRTGSFNEVSGRYSEIPESFYIPTMFKAQSQTNKQCSGDVIESDALTELAFESMTDSFDVYERLLAEGVSREQARIVLPLATHTEFVWGVDLRNLLHFIKLRMAPNAQSEIQEYAKAILSMIREIVPISVEAFEEYVLNARTFSAKEMRALYLLLNLGGREMDYYEGWSEREITEFRNKINLMS